MTESERSLEILFDQASRARRLARVLSNDRVVADLERYAEELEAEIDRRAVLD